MRIKALVHQKLNVFFQQDVSGDSFKKCYDTICQLLSY
jgi:hypothetical protein